MAENENSSTHQGKPDDRTTPTQSQDVSSWQGMDKKPGDSGIESELIIDLDSKEVQVTARPTHMNTAVSVSGNTTTLLGQHKSDAKTSSSQSQDVSCSWSEGINNEPQITSNKDNEVIIHLHSSKEQVDAKPDHLNTQMAESENAGIQHKRLKVKKSKKRSKDASCSSSKHRNKKARISKGTGHKNGHVCVYCGEGFQHIKSFTCHKRPYPPGLSIDHESVEIPISCDISRPMPNPQKCSECGYVCNGLRDMVKHKKKEHPKSSKYTCKFCRQTFAERMELEDHKKAEHPREVDAMKKESRYVMKDFDSALIPISRDDISMANPQKCWDCGFVCDGLNDMMKHKKEKHPKTVKFTCKFCSQTFAERSILDNHKRAEHMGEINEMKKQRDAERIMKHQGEIDQMRKDKEEEDLQKKCDLKRKIEIVDWHRENGSRPTVTAAKWGCHRKTLVYWDKHYDMYIAQLKEGDSGSGRGRGRRNRPYPYIPQRQNWTVKQKVEIVDYFRSAGRNLRMTASHWGCDRKCLSQWDKDYDKFKELSEMDKMKDKKRLHPGPGVSNVLSPQLDSEMLVHFNEQYERGHIMSSTEISEKAQQLAVHLRLDGFKASYGWVHRWKARNGITISRKTKQRTQEEEDYAEILLTLPDFSSAVPE